MKKPLKKSVASRSSIVDAAVGADKYEAAFDKTKAARDALPGDALIPRTLETATAVSVALAAYPRMIVFRSRIEKQLRNFDVAQFEAIEDFANAMFHADGLAESAPNSGGVGALYQEAVSLRGVLNSDLKALVMRKLVAENALDDVSNVSGFKNVAVALMALSSIARQNWGAISSKTGLTWEEIEHARDVAARLLTLLSSRERAEAIGQANETLQRAATLLVNAYGEARAALAYIRRKERDVAMIAPSLYANRGRRKSKASTPP